MQRLPVRLASLLVLLAAVPAFAAPALQLEDIFELEHAADPRVAPDGRSVAYLRRGMDVMEDRATSRLWLVDARSHAQQPLATGPGEVSHPRFSPDGGRIAFIASNDGERELRVLWPASGRVATVARLPGRVEAPAWSPDGRLLAFVMAVPAENSGLDIPMPARPDGARWAEPVKVIDHLLYRRDDRGYTDEVYGHLFVVPADGGTPRRLTGGDYDHRSPPVWLPGGDALVVAANRRDDWEREPLDTDLWRVSLADGALTRLTDRYGPDESPAVGPGGWLAWTGFDDTHQGYRRTRLYVAGPGGAPQELLPDFDRSVHDPAWDAGGRHVWFLYEDRGETRLARASLSGGIEDVAGQVGGTTLGRPYASGSFSIGPDGRYGYTRTDTSRPADVAFGKGGEAARLTGLNEDLLGHRALAEIEEIRYPSSHDGREIQGWIARPPGFDPDRRYPLLLEIHGGPFADYGARFSAEVQLYAAAGYVVLYTNPRGSTGYGEEFGNLIHHAYPGHDYDDLMSGVDAVIARGHVDPDRLYVTGGSGGGVLSAWIVGRTDRFRAAVVAKPVINWTSFTLTSDVYNFFWRYWFGALPWEDPENYFRRSPLSLAGEVSTPTLVLVGEQDFRTPISESEQYFQALKLAGVETALVRVPGASHNIARRPSQLAAKVSTVLTWFARHGGAPWSAQ